MVPASATVERWLRGRPGFAVARVLSVEPVTGGASNITCRVRLAGAPVASVALRLERTRGIFEPYDVLREGRVLRCLARSAVPVPAVLFDEADPAILGGPFLILEWVDAPHMGEAGVEADFGAYTAAVVAIHALDWRAIGLEFLGVPATPADGIVAEVDAIARRMPNFGCDRDPLLLDALGLLRATAPNDGRLALCQGDVNVFNYLFRDRRVAAVVDWEQARISDPRCDVGHLVALGNLRGAPFGPAADASFVRAYEAVSGLRLPGMEYFRARWLFELGVIHYGWRAFNDSDPWYSWIDLTALLEQSLAALA